MNGWTFLALLGQIPIILVVLAVAAIVGTAGGVLLYLAAALLGIV